MMDQINLAIVDDEQLFVAGLNELLSRHADFEVLVKAYDGKSFLENELVKMDKIHLVLLDLRMKPLNGIDVINQLKESNPNVKVMVLTTHYQDTFINYMIKLGVNAFLPKNTDPDELAFAIRKVHYNGLYFTEESTTVMRQQSGSSRIPRPSLDFKVQLTRREEEVLVLICEELTNAEIGEKLFISKRTVEGHRNNLLLKIGAKNTAGLVTYALVNQLLNTEEKLLEYTLHQ